MTIKLDANYIMQIRQDPSLLYLDLQDGRVLKQDAIIAVGMVMYGVSVDASFNRIGFRDFWLSRIGARRSFEAAVADTELNEAEFGYVAHMHKVAEALMPSGLRAPAKADIEEPKGDGLEEVVWQDDLLPSYTDTGAARRRAPQMGSSAPRLEGR